MLEAGRPYLLLDPPVDGYFLIKSFGFKAVAGVGGQRDKLDRAVPPFATPSRETIENGKQAGRAHHAHPKVAT